MAILREVKEELTLVLKGQTLDALWPALVFILLNSKGYFAWGLVASVLIAGVFSSYRYLKKSKWQYALGGLLGALVAAGFSILGQASDYFLPQILGSGLLALTCFLSLALKKPLAMWVSHITRGWSLHWYTRPDIRPAYSQVTLLWAGYFLFRTLLQVAIYQSSTLALMFWINTFLELPGNLAILTLSYLYGIYRLKKLGGPGNDEFEKKTPGPWLGQRRGF